ncbi:MAG: lipid A biosynthesis acyltransferase [Oleiphilaceae bacterium]|nr:lipid A biosynthesis acyltransferase [Oleiphilaceae bacterium]
MPQSDMRPIDPEYYYRHFIHPRYWGTWCVLALLYVISWLPYSAKLRLGKSLGLLLYRLGGSRRRTAQANIRACFPEYSAQQQEQLVKDSFISNATGYVESTISWWGNPMPFVEQLSIHGQEHIDEAKRRGKGVLIIGAHFSIMDFAGPLVYHTVGFNYMYRPQNNKLLNAFIERKRRMYSGVSFTKRQLKEMIDFIKEGNLVWYGPDQDLGMNRGVFAPFFGIETASLTTPAWIARETGASVLQLAQFREADGTYSLHFSPILEDFPGDDERENAARLNKGLEEHIRIHPEQYLWLHRRFKTRPEGEPSFY